MKTLSRENYEKAVGYLNQGARPLEKALYAYYFSGAAADGVLAELAKFQNEDGGFGHGLECDIRLNNSSVIATTIAFQHFGTLKTSANHPMLAKACVYLLDTFNDEKLNWPIIPPNIDDAPHAPWWVHSGDLEKSMSNPRAEIAGYLNAYPEHFPADMRGKVTASVLDYLYSQTDKLEMHDLLCYIRLWETPNLPEAVKTPLLEKLKRVVNHIVERDPEKWKEYGLPPLTVISSPKSPFADAFQNEIQQNLDFIIEAQGEAGTWEPNWSWGMYPEAWEQAKRELTGVITLENLRKFRAFGRIV